MARPTICEYEQAKKPIHIEYLRYNVDTSKLQDAVEDHRYSVSPVDPLYLITSPSMPEPSCKQCEKLGI